MGTRHAYALGMHPAHIAQQYTALHRLDAPGIGGLQLGIVLMNGGTVHHQLGVPQIGGIVANRHLDAEGTLRLGVFGFFHIRPGDGKAMAVQDLNQRIGPGSAATDKMYGLDAIQQFRSNMFNTMSLHLKQSPHRSGAAILVQEFFIIIIFFAVK